MGVCSRKVIGILLIVLFGLLHTTPFDGVNGEEPGNIKGGGPNAPSDTKSSLRETNRDSNSEEDAPRASTSRVSNDNTPESSESESSSSSSSSEGSSGSGSESSGSGSESSGSGSGSGSSSGESSSDEETPTTSLEGGKRKRKAPSGEKPSKRAKRVSKKKGPSRRILLLRKFVKENYLPMLLAEAELKLFKSESLLLSDYWLSRNNLESEKEFVQAVIRTTMGVDVAQTKRSSMELVNSYFRYMRQIKQSLVPNFDGHRKSIFDQFSMYRMSIHKIECRAVQLSFIILFLVFKDNDFLFLNSVVFYLLLCSFTELEDIEFRESFGMVLKNQHNLGAKIAAIGGSGISSFLSDIKCFFKEFSGYEITGVQRYQRITFPINFIGVNIADFGLNFCLVLLELHILNDLQLDEMQTFLFFAARLSSAAQVLLASDIFKLVRANAQTTTDVVATILFDSNAFARIQRQVMEMHNLDLRSMKDRFDSCIKMNDNFAELIGIRRYTDIQERSFTKAPTHKEIQLRAKYSFL
ncbi:secreted membrane-associated protein [Cryptosporidium canis]|uniref:Secreted membrane-associated protein n=1 Tax=Cryptosporidium canis TaxID=195482 RepID=A0ABQ8P8H4_9CRYT|nr:secreted membrane-associated protein [Cryptosporidium canis]